MVAAEQRIHKATPFVKWAGGKGQLLSYLLQYAPSRNQIGSYYEPFVGGGAFFYELAPAHAVLGDSNDDLMTCYRIIRDQPYALMNALDCHIYDSTYYYQVRSQDPANLSDVERAARFIFLNKSCYNGLYRVNNQGQFNVPFGRYPNPPRFYDLDNLLAISRLLANVTLLTGNYAETLREAQAGDFVYLDPPYAPVSMTADFTSYTQNSFNADDQSRLAQVFRELDARGCLVMLSNSETPLIRDLYQGYDMRVVMATRAINSKVSRRGACAELIIRNYPRSSSIEPSSQRNMERWEQVITANSIDLTRPVSYIDAEKIRAHSGGVDVRLMAKIDRREERPAIFRRNNIFILPVQNGRYALIRGNGCDGYHTLETRRSKPQPFPSRIAFKLHTIESGCSEMQFIDFAYNSGLLEHFLKASVPAPSGSIQMYQTIRGRKFSPAFRFAVNGSEPLEARSVQVEVDAGYESRDHVIIVEGKIGLPNNFLIKQLYYPYRVWQANVDDKKTVLPIFFCYDPDNQTYHFWLYHFADPQDYASLKLVKQRSYKIIEEATSLHVEEVDKDALPTNMLIPQADDVRKLLEIPFKVAEGMDTSASIAAYFEFDRRQSQYYRQALEALGLLVLDSDRYILTTLGQKYVAQPAPDRNTFLASLMLNLPIMNKILIELFLRPEHRLSRDEIAALLQRNSSLTGNTLQRRAATVLAWFRWMERSLGNVRVNGKILRLSSEHDPYQLSLL